MKYLPEFDDERDGKSHVLARALSSKAGWRVAFFAAIIILIVMAIATLCFYSNLKKDIEVDVRVEYENEIRSLEDRLEETKTKYENKLKDAKIDYNKKIADEQEKHDREIENKDGKISELEDKIEEYKVKDKISFDEIEKEIKTVGKLTTIDYHYTYAGTHEDVNNFFNTDIKLPFTKNSFIAQWEGVVALGVDLTKVKITVNESTKIITVTVPNAEIFYHDVDHKSFKTLDEKNNIFNPITVDDINQFNIKYEDKIYEKIEEIRLLEEACENAKTMVENILKAIPGLTEQYTIQFQKNK